MDELKCLNCGYIGEPKIIEELYGDDADGNRGIWITYEECPKCGSDDLTEDFSEDDD